MKRVLLKKLLEWKQSAKRKPLLLDGARQVGKSYLIEHLFGETFSNIYTFNFLENRSLHTLFEETLDPDHILESLELEIGHQINTDKDLIFFDEIGECQNAVNSLKFFCEKKQNIFLCASGSNIGLLDSFPVGKTYNLELAPMSFFEFLMASGNDLLVEKFAVQSREKRTHELLWKVLLDYYFVGGMPEAVEAWYDESSITTKVSSVKQVHRDLISGYTRDFGKYGNKIVALHIEDIFKSVPRKLQESRDDSVKRFSFQNVIANKNRYAQLRGPIDFLVKSNLILKNFIIPCRPNTPLAGLVKDNIFKLFYFDVGLLCYSLGLEYKDIIEQNFSSKGFIAENFVQCELKALGTTPSYCWQEGKSEIEFILKSEDGELVPVEVKSGLRTRAQSLRVYINKYKPQQSLKLTAQRGNIAPRDNNHVWPLYYLQYFNHL